MTDDAIPPAVRLSASERFMRMLGRRAPEPMTAEQRAEYDRKNAVAEADLAARIARRLGRAA